MASGASSSVISRAIKKTRTDGKVFPINLWVSSRPSRSKSTSAKLGQPCLANVSAMARPIPPAAPVTIAGLPTELAVAQMNTLGAYPFKSMISETRARIMMWMLGNDGDSKM